MCSWSPFVGLGGHPTQTPHEQLSANVRFYQCTSVIIIIIIIIPISGHGTAGFKLVKFSDLNTRCLVHWFVDIARTLSFVTGRGSS